MTYEELIERVENLNGERVDESDAENLEGVDLTELKACAFEKSACYLITVNRTYHGIKSVAYTACRAILVYAFEEDGEGDFALFGVPYSDYKYVEFFRNELLKQF